MECNLSIIIVSYNTRKLIIDCVKSILGEGSKIVSEIIVVDNNSTDSSVDTIKQLDIPNSRIKIIENKTNVGFAKANNQGIKIARGKYILLLNSDTKVKKGVFQKLIDYAQLQTDAGVIVPQLLNVDGTIQPSCFKFPTIGRAIKQYWFGQRGVLDKYIPKTHQRQTTTVEVAVMAAFLITPKALKKIGGLDERYFMFFEDFEYCRQIKRAGLKIYYLSTAHVIHIHGGSGKKLADSSNQWRRLIPSSKIYHGLFGHYLFNFVLWSGQKIKRMFSN